MFPDLPTERKPKMHYAKTFHKLVGDKHGVSVKFDEREWHGKDTEWFLQDPKAFPEINDVRQVLDGWRNGTVWFERVLLPPVAKKARAAVKKTARATTAATAPRSDKGHCRERRPQPEPRIRAKFTRRALVRKTPKVVPQKWLDDETEN